MSKFNLHESTFEGRNAMKSNHTLKAVLGLCAILIAGSAAHGGINGGGRSAGRITAFGSIFVNRIEYFTDSATILVNGVPSTQAALRVGQIVAVDGVVNADGRTGTATVVTAASDARGAVTALDTVNSTITVLGQLVHINPQTSFAPAIAAPGLGALSVGQVLEISGFRDAAGDLVASRIDPSAAAGDRVIGTVGSLSNGSLRFKIENLTVDYSAAAQITGSLANGALVEVTGPRAVAGVLRADTLTVLPGGLGVNSGESRLEGYVTAVSGGGFVVGTQPVVLAPDATFVGGTAANLVANAKVEVEGTVDASGTLVATGVTFQTTLTWHEHGLVTAVGDSLAVNGAPVRVSAATRLTDRSRAKLKTLTVADLHVGDWLDVDGLDSGDGSALAAGTLVRVDLDNRQFAEAAVGAVDGASFTQLGVTVLMDGATRISDANGKSLSIAQFDAVAVGHTARVRGTYAGGVWSATQVSLSN